MPWICAKPANPISNASHPGYYIKKTKKQRWLTRGELGCALSHHQVYAHIVRQQHPYALILEDDAEFIRNPQPLLNEGYLNNITEQYPF